MAYSTKGFRFLTFVTLCEKSQAVSSLLQQPPPKIRKLDLECTKYTMTLHFTKTSFVAKHSGRWLVRTLDIDVPLRQVIGARFVAQSRILEVSIMVKRKKEFVLQKVEGSVKSIDDDDDEVKLWVENLLESAYDGVKRGKRLRVIVNPFGGVGKASTILVESVMPILNAAGCTIDVSTTKHSGHAREIAQELDLDYDTVVTLSGDGILHEILNGFAAHSEPMKAFAMPIAPIPTGSGNGMSLNILGIKDGFDVGLATLNAIKGQPMRTDLFSFHQGGRIAYSFMSQSMGLMAEVDLGTENLRWMGDARFVVGFIKGVLSWKSCPVQVSIKVAEQDKSKMVENLKTNRGRVKSELESPQTVVQIPTRGDLPTPRFKEDTEGWITFEKPMMYVYAGQGPYVARDLMQFPVSLHDDGLIDVVIQEQSSRFEILGAITGAAEGKQYWMKSQHYFKAHAYRVKPLAREGFVSVDGESYPFEEFHVEVHKGLATFLSPYGMYAVEYSGRH